VTADPRPSRVQPWTILDSRITYHDPWLKVRTDRCRTASGAEVSPYHVLEYKDVVTIVPLTLAGRLVMLREYRHGAARVMLGLPGGGIEVRDADREAAARRELAEETGFGGGRFRRLLDAWQCAGTHTNSVTTFLALGVEPQAGPSPDLGESLELAIEDFVDILRALRANTLKIQSDHVAALWSAAAVILASEDDGVGELRRRLQATIG
jgi:8-oxo-dGTP pyrophosphatase MutT (NUDIX family)